MHHEAEQQPTKPFSYRSLFHLYKGSTTDILSQQYAKACKFALPNLVPRTAIVGVRNIYDYPDALLELQETFEHSLNLRQASCEQVKELSIGRYNWVSLTYKTVNIVVSSLYY